MKEDLTSKFVDILIMKAGIATHHSMMAEEPRAVINISLELRPSVIAEITDIFEVLFRDQNKLEEKQKKLTTSLSLFLSDAIDCGIISNAQQILKRKGY